MENYTIYDEIGRGTHSFVYKARRKRSIEYVAVKSTAKSRMEKILNEVQILHKLDSRYVLKFYNWYESQNHIWLIFEYCIGGDLLNLITQDRRLPEQAVKAFGWELVAGLQYLHVNSILYCDLKPANILIDECGSLKLSDFGLARRIPTQESLLMNQLAPGSPNYMAPELFKTPTVHSFASDFWSLGCVLYELCTGRPPFTHTFFPELARIIQTEALQIPQETYSISPSLVDLLHRLLDKDPHRRITWQELLLHPFWSGCEQLDPVSFPPQELFLSTRNDSHDELRTESLSIAIPEDPKTSAVTQNGVLRTTADASPATESASDDATSESTRQSDNGSEGEEDAIEAQLTEPSSDDESPFNDEGEDKSTSEPRPITAPITNGRSVKHRIHDRAPQTAPPRAKPAIVPRMKRELPNEGIVLKRTSRLLLTAADCVVKPIAFSSDIETVHSPPIRPELLDFDDTSADNLLACTTEDLEEHLKSIYISLKATDHSAAEKASVLAHLFRLSQQPKLANVIVNSSLLTLLIKMLRQRALVREPRDDHDIPSTIALVLGALFRFATFIASASPEYMDLLATTLTDMILRPQDSEGRATNAKRRAMACLGEFLFYTATQKADSMSVVGLRCLLEVLDDEDAVTKHYAVRTVSNILTQCTHETVSEALVSEQVIASLVRSLVDVARGNDLRAIALQTTISQAITQVFRHLCFPVSTETTRNSKRTKEAVIVMMSKTEVLCALWNGVIRGHDSPELAAASLNVLNSYLELTPARTRKSEPDVISKHQQVLFEKIVEVGQLESLMYIGPRSIDDRTSEARDRTRVHGSTGVRYSDEDQALPNLIQAKVMLFTYYGIRCSGELARRCVKASIIDQVERSLAPHSSLLHSHITVQSPTERSTVVASPKPNKKISTTEEHVLQCSLHLVRLCIRTALRMSAECIASSNSKIDYDDVSDGIDEAKKQHAHSAIRSESFELFDQLVKNPTCRAQLCMRFLKDEGREFKFFIRLMSKLLSSFSSERLPAMQSTVGPVVSRLLRQLLQGSSPSHASALVDAEVKDIFVHLLPALVVQLEQLGRGDDEGLENDEHAVNCIQLIYLIMLHLDYELSDSDYERKDVFTRQHLLPCFATLFSSPKPINENVWRFSIDVLHGIVMQHGVSFTDEFSHYGLVQPIIALLSAPKRHGHQSLPANGVALVKSVVERAKRANELRALYDLEIARHVMDGLAFNVSAHAFTTATLDILEVLYVLLYNRYDELRSTDKHSAEEPPQFAMLVRSGALVLHLCVQSEDEADEPQDSPSKEATRSVNGMAIHQEVLEVASRCLVYISQIFGGRLNEVLFGKQTSAIDVKRAFRDCLQLTHQHDVVQLRVLLTIKNCLRCDKKTETQWTHRWLETDPKAMQQITQLAAERRPGEGNPTSEQTIKAANEILHVLRR